MCRLLILLLSFSFLLSCSSDDDEATQEEPQLTSITIASSNGTTLDLQQSSTLTASGIDQFGENFTLTSVEWSVDNDNATIDQSGIITGLKVGNVVVTAVSEGKEATLSLRVWDSTAPRTEIYVSDAADFNNGPFFIYKYDEDGGNAEKFIDRNLAWPQDIVFLEDKNEVLVSNLSSGLITKYDINTGEYIGNFATGISGPTRMKIGADNLLYVLQWNNSEPVLRYNLDGSFVDEFTSTGINQGIGIDWDSDGNLYVSSFNNGAGGSVRKFDASGNDLGTFISSNLTGPTNIWFDNSGNLLVNDWSANSVKQFDSDGNFVSTFISGISNPEGIGVLASGNLLIGSSNSSVRQYSSSGGFIKTLISNGAGGLITPNAVVVRKVN